MKTTTKNTLRKEYNCPKIIHIKLDNEISLILESLPPAGPNESLNKNTPDFFNNDPFKNGFG